MRRIFKFFIVLVLLLALLAGAAWFFLRYHTDWTIGLLQDLGSSAMEQGRLRGAVRYYDWAYRLSGQDPDLAIELAGAYRKAGNFSRAEYTLVHAISDHPQPRLYRELSQTYVAQGKFLDACLMLDQIADPQIQAELNQSRPSAPTASLEPGFYSQYLDVTITAAEGTLYACMDKDYPSAADLYTAPIHLEAGETAICALTVADNGLVSPRAVFSYTVNGVVEPVSLADPALEQAVRQMLSRSSDSVLTTADLWGITELSVTEEMQDLSDLQYFTGLTALTLESHPGTDLQFLSKMTKLERLNLSGTTVGADILPMIGAMSQLRELNLANCGLSTLAGLENLQNLQILNLTSNSVSDLQPLAGNTSLQELNLQQNAVTSFAPLAGLTELTRLDLSSNLLTNLSGVTSCTKLQYLDVADNNLGTLSGIGSLTALTELSARNCKLTDIAGLRQCGSLQRLDLSDNAITDISELAQATSIVELNVSFNQIIQIPDFPDNAALATFNGCNNLFEDVSGLGGLMLLNYVYLDHNNITDISALTTCYNLVQVNVFQTGVTDVNALLEMDVLVSYNPT